MKGKRYSGEFGELQAVKILKENGYKIICRNFACPFGEIDIIARHKDTLVFVEVKTRWSDKFGKPVESVTLRKISRIKKTADYFQMIHKNLPKKVRIDVCSLEIDANGDLKSKIIHVD